MCFESNQHDKKVHSGNFELIDHCQFCGTKVNYDALPDKVLREGAICLNQNCQKVVLCAPSESGKHDLQEYGPTANGHTWKVCIECHEGNPYLSHTKNISQTWRCQFCLLHNHFSLSKCEKCAAPRQCGANLAHIVRLEKHTNTVRCINCRHYVELYKLKHVFQQTEPLTGVIELAGEM